MDRVVVLCPTPKHRRRLTGTQMALSPEAWNGQDHARHAPSANRVQEGEARGLVWCDRHHTSPCIGVRSSASGGRRGASWEAEAEYGALAHDAGRRQIAPHLSSKAPADREAETRAIRFPCECTVELHE